MTNLRPYRIPGILIFISIIFLSIVIILVDIKVVNKYSEYDKNISDLKSKISINEKELELYKQYILEDNKIEREQEKRIYELEASSKK